MDLRQGHCSHRALELGIHLYSARQVTVIWRDRLSLAEGCQRCNPDCQLGIAGKEVHRQSGTLACEPGIDSMADAALTDMAEQKGERTLSLEARLQNFGNPMGNDRAARAF